MAVAGLWRFVRYVGTLWLVRGSSSGHGSARRPADACGPRLLSLDYIIERPTFGWLPTEADKVQRFEALGVDRKDFPCRLYGPDGTPKIPRYFAFKLPIAVDDQAVTFAYVDAGQTTDSASYARGAPPTPPGPRRQRGRGFYGRAVVRRVCGHVACRLAAQRGQVCQERLAIEFPAVPAALPAPECNVPRSPFRRAATITARAAHRTGAVIFAPDAPPPRPPLQRRFQVGPVRHASPERPAFRGPLRRFLRASLINGSPRETASRITAETDVCVASASASSAAAVAGSTVTRNCFE